MDAFLIYILKSAVCFGVFYLFIKFFLLNETFVRFNRIVLLSGVVICLILPFVNIGIEKSAYIPTSFYITEESVPPSLSFQRGDFFSENLSIEVMPDIKSNAETFDYVPILIIVYGVGLLINLISLLVSIYRMLGIIKRGSKIRYEDYTLVIVDENINPFSWRKYIVLSRADYSESQESILVHEIAHTKYYHSADLIFMEIILLLQWFNPVLRLLKRELKDIHEYQADARVLQSGIDTTKYQLLLVRKAVGASSYTLANSFNHGKIKKRITMMLKEKSNKWMRLKLLLVLPLVALTLYAFATPEVEPEGSFDKLTVMDDGPDFCFPLPTSHKIVSKYGKRGKDKVYFHQGCDLKGIGKDTIYAAFKGTVSSSQYKKKEGNYIILSHKDGMETYYAHNSVNLVKEGDVVKAGQAIAIIGNTGRSTGEHLHFEIRKNGKSIDPETIIDFEKRTLR